MRWERKAVEATALFLSYYIFDKQGTILKAWTRKKA
jgi:hypothetical protein